MDAIEKRARELTVAMTVEEVAKLISGAPFPSKQSLSKARAVVEYMSNRAALTPPEGYVLLPFIPSYEMTKALADTAGCNLACAALAYRDALSARPEVP